MRNFHPSRTRAHALLTPSAALVSGLLLALGCSVYDDALLNDEATLAGSSSGGASGSKSEGGTAEQPQAGKSSAGTGSTTSAGSEPGAGSGGVVGGVGGTSGGTPSAGSAGTSQGGTPPAGDLDSVDNMEDADQQISEAPGRNGYWYVGNDGTVGGVQEPPVGAFAMFELTAGERPSSSYAAHMKVEGFTGWGSVIGLNFTEQLGMLKIYDATAYCGVSFWAKAAAATTLRFRLPDGDTHPAGGVCVDGGPAGQACYDHFSTSAAFSVEWKQLTVMFAELQQVGTGYHPADMKLKAGQLYGLEWALPGSGKAFEIWIDDVELLKCQ